MNHHQWDKNPASFQLSLMNMLRFNEVEEILDAGCAGGQLHQYIFQQRKKNCKLTACDYSEQMVKVAAARMLKFLNNPLQGEIMEMSPQEIDSVDINSPLLEQNNYKIFQGDVQQLQQLNDNQFDIYVSNLVIHLVENKDQALKEAFRVLKPGGKIGIVIPVASGNQLNKGIGKVFIQSGLIENVPSITTDLDKRENMIEFIKKFGFTDILCWNQTIPYDLYDIDHNYIFPKFEEILETAQKEQVDLFYQLFQQEVQKQLNSNQPYLIEGLCLIAKKPQI